MAATKKPRWKSRIVAHDDAVPAGELIANPANARMHGQAQRAALGGLLDEVGFVASVIVNRTSGMLLDGHLRVEMAAEAGDTVPVDYVELDADEERMVLALMDPIGAMAEVDTDALAELTKGLNLSFDLHDALSNLLPGVDDDDTEKAVPLRTTKLAPLGRVFVLLTVPLDEWEEVGPVLDQLALTTNVTIQSNVK